MSSDILIIDGNYHLGNNIGLFQTAIYVGIKLTLPMKTTWINDSSNIVSFVFITTDMETWEEWQGHKVSINGEKVGYIKDDLDGVGSKEVSVIEIDKNKFLQLLKGKDDFVMEIELGRQKSTPGLADDFRLVRISSRDVAIKIG